MTSHTYGKPTDQNGWRWHMGDLSILGAADVVATLAGRELEVLTCVRRAYEAHALGQTSLPHSGFLRFPDNERDRIISLPAYLGGDDPVAGLKWIASVPGNVERGLERASAVMVLNDRSTGRPYALLEGSIISKQRTAASAALAAELFRRDRPTQSIGFVGCGPINAEVARFLATVFPSVADFYVLDLDRRRASAFAENLVDGGAASADVTPDLETLLASSDVVAFGTTAGVPHVADLAPCRPGTTILHVSLRDLAPEIILDQPRVINVVDDYSHVCRARTSIHLASEKNGRDAGFVHASIGELLLGKKPLPANLHEAITIFSPFGLGILDLAVAQLVVAGARDQGRGTAFPGFLP